MFLTHMRWRRGIANSTKAIWVKIKKLEKDIAQSKLLGEEVNTFPFSFWDISNCVYGNETWIVIS